MKRFFLLLCVVCGLYTFSIFSACGLSWGDMGESIEGQKANPNVTHEFKLDSAKFIFYYPYGNEYKTVYGYPDDDDSLTAVDTTVAGMDLDSIGLHTVKITYYPHDGGSTTFGGSWLHVDPTPGDTIQRNASTLTEDNNIGIDLDDVLGTLDAGEIGNSAIGATQVAAGAIHATAIATGAISATVIATDAIGASELAPDAITAVTIADDAIDYATFAASAPTAWWNEGKTGYSLSSSEWEKVWYDIDTTNVDTSDIGDWFINNIAGGGGSDTTAIKAMHNNRGTSTFDPATDTVVWVDTVFYAGVAQKNTEAEITGWVKATLEDTSNVARDATKDDYKDGSAGTGADTFNIYVFDADTTAIEGVNITIYNKGHTAVAAPLLTTDVNGLAITFQDADTFHLYLQRLGVIYTEWDTIVVSNQGIDTLWVTAYDPGTSPSPSLTCIQGYNGDVGGNTGDRLTIILRPIYGDLIDTSTGIFIVHKEHYVYSDTGFFAIYVTPSINLISKQPGGDIDSVRYDLIVKKGYIKQFEWSNILVPISAGCIWLKDILE